MKLATGGLNPSRVFAVIFAGASAIAVAAAILVPPPVTAAGNEHAVVIALTSAAV